MKLKLLFLLLFACFISEQSFAQGKRPTTPVTPVDSTKLPVKPTMKPPVVLEVKDSIPEPVVALKDSVKADSIALDTTKKGDNKFVAFFRKDDKHAPKKALVYSLMLPGAGQVYNKSYWKLPIVYGAFAGMGYVTYWNTRQYKKFREGYEFRVDTFPETVDTFGLLSDGALKNLSKDYQKNVELAYIGLFAVYGLTAIDAFVDAHLKNFDVGDDLSMQIRPTLMYSRQGEMVPGVGLRFRQRRVQTKQVSFFKSP